MTDMKPETIEGRMTGRNNAKEPKILLKELKKCARELKNVDLNLGQLTRELIQLERDLKLAEQVSADIELLWAELFPEEFHLAT